MVLEDMYGGISSRLGSMGADGAETEVPRDVPENAESRRKWKIKCGKALFALRTSISKEFIDHVRDVSSPKEVWQTLESVCTKKNTARLQLLENELAMLTQGGMSVSEYFLRIKSCCAEISEIDMNEKISEACQRRYLIRGLRKEYGPFVTSIQGWANQPSVEELDNLLCNQEALAKQMAKSLDSDAVLFSKGKSNKKNAWTSNKGKDEDTSADKGKNSQSKKPITCFRCGKTGHIQKNCRVKLAKAKLLAQMMEMIKLNGINASPLKQSKKRKVMPMSTTSTTRRNGSSTLVALIMQPEMTLCSRRCVITIERELLSVQTTQLIR